MGLRQGSPRSKEAFTDVENPEGGRIVTPLALLLLTIVSVMKSDAGLALVRSSLIPRPEPLLN